MSKSSSKKLCHKFSPPCLNYCEWFIVFRNFLKAVQQTLQKLALVMMMVTMMTMMMISLLMHSVHEYRCKCYINVSSHESISSDNRHGDGSHDQAVI